MNPGTRVELFPVLRGNSANTQVFRPRPEGLTSVIVDKTAIVLGQGLFGLLGLALACTVVPVYGPIITAMTVLLIVQALALTGFVAVQLQIRL